MEDIYVKVFELKNKEDFDKANNMNQNLNDFIPTSIGKDYYNLWNARYKFIQPGMSQDNVKALEFLVGCPLSYNIDDLEFARFVLAFFEKQFGKQNVLSLCMGKSKTLYAHVLAFPLDRRVLNSSKWEINNKVNGQISIEFIKMMSDSFEIKDESLKEKEQEAINKENQSMEVLNNYRFTNPWLKETDGREQFYSTNNTEELKQTNLPYDQIKATTDKTLQYFISGPEKRIFNQVLKGDMPIDNFENSIKIYLTKNFKDLTDNDRDYVINKLFGAVYGNYILDPLINDDNVSDIKVLYPKIRLKVNGKRMTSNLRFINENDFYRFIDGLAIKNHLDFRYKAINHYTDKTSNEDYIMRVNITTNTINSTQFPYLHIRKTPKNKKSIQDLIDANMMNDEIATYLINKAKTGRSLVFTGKGGSGKTTAMNTLLEYIPYDQSGLVIQESEELFSDFHPDLMFQHVIDDIDYGGTYEKGYDLAALARNGLLVDLDYFIIAEIKGAEALYFLNAADTGHKCWCSVHGPNSTEAIDKLADYVMYEGKYSKNEAMQMLRQLEVVVFMKDYKVYEISEIVEWDYEKKELIYKEIYRRE